MKTPFTGLAVAAVLVIAPALPGYAEDAAAPRGDPRAHHCSNARVCSTRGAAAKRAASVAGAENRGAGLSAGRGRSRAAPAAALRGSSPPAIWLLPQRLLGAVSDLLAAFLPPPDSLEPDSLGVSFLTRDRGEPLNPALENHQPEIGRHRRFDRCHGDRHHRSETRSRNRDEGP